jgi:hypothetical protein
MPDKNFFSRLTLKEFWFDDIFVHLIETESFSRPPAAVVDNDTQIEANVRDVVSTMKLVDRTSNLIFFEHSQADSFNVASKQQ